MDFIKLPFWKRWLLHSFLIWIVVNVSSIISYSYRIVTSPNHEVYPNYTLWDKLVNLNYNQSTIFLILFTLLLVEANQHFLHRKRLIIFVFGCSLTGLLVSVTLLISYQIENGHVNLSIAMPFWLVAAYAFVYPVLLEFFSRRIIRAESQSEHSSAELNALKTQINPHFLFNTLNSLYGTALKENASGTASGIEQLAEMMRYMLNEASADFVKPELELNFLKEYIQLQRMRLPAVVDKHVVTFIHCDESPVKIAPLLLIPFVENAFKYGLDVDKECYINLSIIIKDDRLEMKIENSIANPDKGNGTGLNNAKKRLELLYDGRHRLVINRSETFYRVELAIDLNK